MQVSLLIIAYIVCVCALVRVFQEPVGADGGGAEGARDEDEEDGE